jgi:tRNA(adenine34) deaminase
VRRRLCWRSGERFGVIPTPDDHRFLALALLQARDASSAGEVPVGAVIVCEARVVAQAQNRMLRDGDATSHAELLALRDAAKELGESRLNECTLYITLEPCAMCAGAIVLSRVKRVVFSAWDDKAGMAGSVGDILRHPRLNHRPEVLGGVDAEPSAELLRRFFAERRG